MPDKKISELTEVASLASGDEFAVVDKSDTTQAGSGTTKRATRDTVRASVAYEAPLNPMWPEYGALFDGTTNDAAAIQTCMDAGPTFLPPGSASLGTTGLTITRSDLLMFGSGRETSELKYTGTGAAIKNSNTALTRRRDTFRDFTVDVRSAGVGARGVEVENLYQSTWSQVYIDGGGNANLRAALKLVGTGSTFYNEFYGVNLSSGGTYCVESVNAGANHWYGGLWDGAAVALRLDGSGTNLFARVEVEATEGGVMFDIAAVSGNNQFAFLRCEPAASNINIAAGCGNNQFWGGTYTNVTFNDVGAPANQTIILVPSTASDGLFSWGGLNANRKKTFELPQTTANNGITIGDDTNIYRPSADMLATDDELALMTAGKGIRIKEGSNARMGTATLVGGTVTVSTTAVATGDRIYLTAVNTGGTAGFLSYTISNGTSFTVTSSSGTDTRTFNWLIVRPA